MTDQLLAQGIINPVLPPKIGNDPDNGGGIIGLFIGNIMAGIMIIAFLLALLYLLMGGLSWVTSGGDKAQLESARNKITHAIIGLIIIASVWAIMNIVGPFLGINFPNLPIPSVKESYYGPI